MAWDFETDELFAADLAWADDFVATKVEPLDLLVDYEYDVSDPLRNALIRPLQSEVKDRGLWASHLGPELGGSGFGQLKLALLNEILGRTRCGPIVFGCQAPDSGNSEILALFGTPIQKERYLAPLIAGEIVSSFSMTEPQGGANPKIFTTRAERDGEDWVINGEKWFTSNARVAAFLLVMAITDPEAAPYDRMSMFIVPADTPGIEILRNVALGTQALGRTGEQAYVRYVDVRIPGNSLLGDVGDAFRIAQRRLGGGRVHYAMRTVGRLRRLFEMLCERAVSRTTQDGLLGDKQLVQDMIAESWIEIGQLRLLTLQTAWKIDKYHDYRKVGADVAAVKIIAPRVLASVATRAVQIHGSLGLSNEMPFVDDLINSLVLGLGDGPTEVHKVTLARQVLRTAQPSPSLFPTRHVPSLRAQAERQYGEILARFPASGGQVGHG